MQSFSRGIALPTTRHRTEISHDLGEGVGVDALRWYLKPDGSLDGEPTVVEPQSAPEFRVAALAAIQVVKICAPFALPPEQYAAWKTVT